MDAAKELLQYGLKGTDLEALIAIGKGEDGGRFAGIIFVLFLCFEISSAKLLVNSQMKPQQDI